MVNSVQTTPWTFKAALCLLSPFCFLIMHSAYLGRIPAVLGIISFFSPLPILYLFLGIVDGSAKRWGYGGIALGTVLCIMSGGANAGVGYLIMAGLPAAILGEALIRGMSVERSFLICFAALTMIFATVAFQNLEQIQTEQIPKFRSELTVFIQKILDENKDMYSEAQISEFKAVIENPERWLWRIPGILLVALQVLSSLSLLILLRWNPKGLLFRLGISRDYLRRWRTPDHLVWVAILFIASQAQPNENLSIAGEIIGWPIVFLYFLHGLSILSYYLDLFRVRGPLRAAFYGIALVPQFGTAVVSFGFFDLWLNIRERVRDSKRGKRQKKNSLDE